MEGTRLHQSNVRSSKVPDVQSVWSASCTQAASARPPLSRSQREGEVEFQLRIGERVDGVNASAESWRLDKARERMHTCTAVIKAVHAARGQVLSSLYTRLSNNFRSPEACALETAAVQTVQKEKHDPLHCTPSCLQNTSRFPKTSNLRRQRMPQTIVALRTEVIGVRLMRVTKTGSSEIRIEGPVGTISG